ncbi:hypothetical protein UlMin_015951 [Ulmus minor]
MPSKLTSSLLHSCLPSQVVDALDVHVEELAVSGCYVSKGRVVQHVHSDLKSGRPCYERAIGAFTIMEMLFSSSLLAIVGAAIFISSPPLFDTVTRTTLQELNFLTSRLAIRMNWKRLLVILQDKTYIYDIKSLTILDTIDTVPNLKGFCTFSPSLDGCFLALPIDVPRSPLAVMALSSSGVHIATSSEQGTIIRVHLVSEATKSYSFQRGTYPSTIYSLSFGKSMELPDILVATSSSSSIHGFSMCQRFVDICFFPKVVPMHRGLWWMNFQLKNSTYRRTVTNFSTDVKVLGLCSPLTISCTPSAVNHLYWMLKILFKQQS